MKKFIAVSLTLSLALSGISAFAPQATSKVEAAGYTYTTQQTAALNHLNAIRKNSGLSPVVLNPFLNKSAENHANYLMHNGSGGEHREISGKKGYTGEYPHDRAKAAGAPDALAETSSEGISYGKSDIQSGINDFMTGAYHREPLMKENLTDIGVALVSGRVVLTYGFSEEKYTTDAVYPYNGQTKVGVGFYGAESPNPLVQFGLKQSGFIISYSEPADVYVDDLTTYKLTDSKGVSVPVFKENNFGIWFFYPKQLLKTGEKYTMSLSYTGEVFSDSGNNTQRKVSKTWSFTTTGTSTVTPPPVAPVPSPTGFVDYKTGQYWSEPMLWAINKGLISGYTNVKNPKTGKLENWIKPMDVLTEAQFLSVMFRYTNKAELDATKPTIPTYWASTAYQLAAKYKLPTNSTLTNRTYASKVITRGKMAHILASKHYGKAVSQQTAVQFMYNAGLSNGYVDQYGKTPKTYASYGVNDGLKRGQIATFMKNYDAYLNKK